MLLLFAAFIFFAMSELFLISCRYANVITQFILMVHRENTVSLYSEAISKLLRDYITPDYSFAFRVFASTDNDPIVREMVTRGIRNWSWDRWEINHTRYFKATSELIEEHQPKELRITLNEDLDEVKDKALTDFLYVAKAINISKLRLRLRSSNS